MGDFRYIKNISDGVGEIRIYEPIGLSMRNGKEVGISGSVFASEMAHLKEVCNKINIRINSDGGSVLDGYAIFSSIINAGVETESFIDGVAASTAGWCAMAANKCSIMDYATLMVHGVSGSDDKQFSDMVNSSIAKMLSNRSGMNEDEAKDLMNKETWYFASNKKDSDTLINKKFVDKIVNTGKKVIIKKAEVKNLASMYNQLINPVNMSKINTLLKLRNDAEESEQETAIVSLTKQLADKETELTDLKNRLTVIEDEKAASEAAAKVALKNKAEALVNQLEKEGKLKADEKPATVEALVNNFDFTANLLSKLGNGKQSQKPFDFTKVENKMGGLDNRSDWNWSKWSKEDPSGLQKIANETPEVYQEMYNKEFKK